MNEFSSYCDDFCVTCYLNTELDLPNERGTVVHFFEQISKAFPTMTNFYSREAHEFVLEEEREEGAYRWMGLEARRLVSGYLNPSDLESCHKQNELMLDLAPPIFSVGSLDCEALDVVFGFDFIYRGNHDEIVGQAFARDSRFESLIAIPQTKLVEFEPTITVALDDTCKLQARLNILTRTNSYQVRTGQYNEEPISVFFTVRQFWGPGTKMTFGDSYRRQVEIVQDMVHEHVLPNVVIPLHEAISSR